MSVTHVDLNKALIASARENQLGEVSTLCEVDVGSLVHREERRDGKREREREREREGIFMPEHN